MSQHLLLYDNLSQVGLRNACLDEAQSANPLQTAQPIKSMLRVGCGRLTHSCSKNQNRFRMPESTHSLHGILIITNPYYCLTHTHSTIHIHICSALASTPLNCFLSGFLILCTLQMCVVKSFCVRGKASSVKKIGEEDCCKDKMTGGWGRTLNSSFHGKISEEYELVSQMHNPGQNIFRYTRAGTSSKVQYSHFLKYQ